jgi:hypothetical protein
VERTPYRILRDHELTADESAVRDALRSELLALHEAVESGQPAPTAGGRAPRQTLVGRGPWHFGDDGASIIIVCPELPADLLKGIPHADPDNFDYTELSRLTDLDALFELHGHIRAVNPDAQVEYRRAPMLRGDDTTAHVVVLGGVDWNTPQRDFLRLVDAPVVQRSEPDNVNRGGFEVTGTDVELFRPTFDDREGGPILVEDVGHFFRGPNPFNHENTVTLCNGMFSRGVLGSVRALTDKQLRDRNGQFIEERFATAEAFSILFRVPIVGKGVVVTPDWTDPGNVLHTWMETTG